MFPTLRTNEDQLAGRRRFSPTKPKKSEVVVRTVLEIVRRPGASRINCSDGFQLRGEVTDSSCAAVAAAQPLGV